MKRLLLLILIGLCGFAWRSDDLLKLMGLVHLVRNPDAVVAAAQRSELTPPQGMSMTELLELAKTDPNAYNKFLASYQPVEPRSEIDKLMNFFSTLKYE